MRGVKATRGQRSRPRRRAIALAAAGLTAAIGVGACGGGDTVSDSTPVPQPSQAQLAASGLADLPLAPDSARIDLTAPPFSHSTDVTNPLFPISDLHSAVLNGTIDGKPFHTETTLLPYTRIIEWTPGQKVETLVSQYVAFLDGRLQEVALDYYAQADDGSVWYFGEDVADYNPEGVIAYTSDSWLAGQDGPPAMIMPGDPTVGQAFRTENIPGLVFEEVTTKAVGKTVAGPTGPVEGAMVGRELHDDGMASDKVFAPGYGEFLTKDTDGIEAMALAVPTDALDSAPPAELVAVEDRANQAFDAIRSGGWGAASTDARAVSAAWRGFQGAGQVPPRLEPPMARAVASLSRTVAAHDRESASTAAIDVSQAALDLQLRYTPPAEIDHARFDQWTRQLIVDAEARDLGGVSGDLATIEWTLDRFRDTLGGAELTGIYTQLLALRDAVNNKDLAAAGKDAAKLQS